MVWYRCVDGLFWGTRTANRKDWLFFSMSMFVILVAMKRAEVRVMAIVKSANNDPRAMPATIRPSKGRSSFCCNRNEYAAVAMHMIQHILQ